jgi:SAM-dependent methyltransferase
MEIEKFFMLFMEELKQHNNMTVYYKFLWNKKHFYFRKNYFCRRLEYIARNAGATSNRVWDPGCGYGTVSLFLTLNGYKVHGTTVGVYYDEIPRRIKYWSQFGNVSNFTYEYANLFDLKIPEPTYDRIVLQDTLHHLEPINDSLSIFYKALKPTGKLIIIEENGQNLFQRGKDFIRRGNKRVIEICDERLGKKILLGNENIRSFALWQKLLNTHLFNIEDYEYLRLFLPFQWTDRNYEEMQTREKEIWRRNKFLRNYFYMGINFIAGK